MPFSAKRPDLLVIAAARPGWNAALLQASVSLVERDDSAPVEAGRHSANLTTVDGHDDDEAEPFTLGWNVQGGIELHSESDNLIIAPKFVKGKTGDELFAGIKASIEHAQAYDASKAQVPRPRLVAPVEHQAPSHVLPPPSSGTAAAPRLVKVTRNGKAR